MKLVEISGKAAEFTDSLPRQLENMKQKNIFVLRHIEPLYRSSVFEWEIQPNDERQLLHTVVLSNTLLEPSASVQLSAAYEYLKPYKTSCNISPFI